MEKINVSKDVLRDYSVLKKTWRDITYIPYTRLEQGDVVCLEYYRMTLEDIREMLITAETKRIKAIDFFMEWWEPMLVHLYDGMCLSDLFGDNPANIKDYRFTTLPYSDEDLMMWILKRIFKLYEELTVSTMNIRFSEYANTKDLVLMIDSHWDEAELPPHKRTYVDDLKRDFISEYDNDLILQDADNYTRKMFKLFTDELAAKKDLTALRIKGYACYGGNSIYDCDWQTAADCMEILWKEGSFGYAANTLGYIYYYGRLNNGIPDYEKAFFYYSVASAYGIIESTYKLSDMFMNGYYVKKNVYLASALIEKLYGESRYRFEMGEFDGKFADVAFRMGLIQLNTEDLMLAEVGKLRALRFFLQARFAIALRIKENYSYGDNKVRDNIERELMPLLSDFKISKRSFRSSSPDLIYEFVRSHAYGIYSLSVKKLKNERVKFTVTRLPTYDENEPDMTLVTYPMFACCDLTDTLSYTADRAQFLSPGDRDEFVFDRIETIEKQDMPDTHIFFYRGDPVASIRAESYVIKKPEK
ncbi:MAG: sel1 repeat family protein [Clostridiales bacterium]|nr:sel1 repeat family protein [Clostridiales bacterium]